MNNFLYRKLSRNTSAHGFSLFITIFMQAISVPVLLSNWGINLYGEWLILSTIPTYLFATDFGIGFGAGANNKLSMLLEKNKIKQLIEKQEYGLSQALEKREEKKLDELVTLMNRSDEGRQG